MSKTGRLPAREFEAPPPLDDTESRFRRVIPRGMHHYRIEVSTVRHMCKRATRFKAEHEVTENLYEARVLRGGFWAPRMGARGMWCGGVECAGPGWDDTFGRTALEAAHKARRIARDWVRWQLWLERSA